MELNKIYNENCIDTMRRMPDNFIDLTVTSPPYDNLRTYNDDIDKTWGDHIWKPIIKELFRVTKDGGVVVWVVGDATIDGSETGTSFKQALYAMECGFNLHDTMIWNKNSFTAVGALKYRYGQVFEYMFVFTKGKIRFFNPINDRKNKQYGKKINGTIRKKNSYTIAKSTNGKITTLYGIRYNVWNLFAENNNEVRAIHPAVFPEKLAADHIYSWSNEGDIVYDPFMGSGTTAKMAHIHKRKWIGSEISKEYVDMAYKRIDPYLRQTSLF